MKDDKKIIKEVKRLQEIMGINKPLLLEQGRLIADLVGTLARKELTKFSKELTTAIGALTDATTAEAKKTAADKVIQLARKESPNGLYKKIMNVASKDVDIKKVLDDLFSDEEINTFRLSVQKLLRNGETDGQILNAYRTMIRRSDLSEIQRAALEKRIRDEISNLRKTTSGIPDIKLKSTNDDVRITNDADDVVDDVADDVADDVVDDVADDVATDIADEVDVEDVIDDIKSWAKWDDIPDYTSQEIDDLLQFNGFKRWLAEIFTNKEKQLLNRVKRFNKLSKVYSESITKDIPIKVQVKLQNEMVEELKFISQKNMQNRAEASIWIDNTVKGFEKNKKGVIIDPDERRFAEWAKKVTDESGQVKGPSELRKLNTNESVTNDLVEGFKEAFRHWTKFKDKFKMFNPKNWFSPSSADDVVRNTATNSQWFLRGSRRGAPWWNYNRKNWDDVIDAAGMSSARKQYFYELLFRYFQFHMIWGLGETIYQSINAASSSKEVINKVQGCINARALPNSDNTKNDKLKKFCASLKTMNEITLLHYWEDPAAVNLLKNMFYDWGDKDGGLTDMVTNLFPGKLDDTIIDYVIPYYRGTRDAKTIQQWQDNMEELTGEAEEIAKETEKELVDVIEKEIKPELPKTTSGEPGSLEHFIEDTGAVGATIVNGVIMFGGYGYKWDDTEKEYVDVE